MRCDTTHRPSLVAVTIAICAISAQPNSNGKHGFTLNNNPTYLRGSNYIRLINASIPALFEPDLYPRWDIESAMQQMHAYGYNYVRMFIDCPILYHGFGLSSPGVPMSFTQNIVDFLIIASKYEIAVMLTASWNPANYQSIINSYPMPANASLIAFQNIFAIDIFNEISVSVHQQPYSLTSGIVIFEGVSYDMAKGTDR